MSTAPGPWEWVIEDHSMAILYGPDDAHVMAVSPCKSCIEDAEPKEWKWGRCQTPTADHARLIAAAPDLLDALQFYLDAQPQCECTEHSGCAMAAARAKARAAIAKALGQK